VQQATHHNASQVAVHGHEDWWLWGVIQQATWSGNLQQRKQQEQYPRHLSFNADSTTC
jgi:hypothetical protein